MLGLFLLAKLLLTKLLLTELILSELLPVGNSSITKEIIDVELEYISRFF
jgi:hypothetical protein